MKYTTAGRIASGIGALGVWVDNVDLGRPGAGETTAWGPDVLYQSAEGTIRGCHADGSGDTLVDGHPSTLIAGDNLSPYWATFLADGVTGVRDSLGNQWPAAGLLGIKDSTLFLKTSYAAGGISAWQAGRLLWELPTAQPAIGTLPQFSALDPWRCVWTDAGGRLQTYGLPAPAQTEPIFDPVVLEAAGALWLAGHGGPVILRPWHDASRGYVLEPAGGFYTIGRVLDPTHVELAWSRGPGANGDVVRMVADLTLPMGPLEGPPTPLPPVTIAPFDHPQWVGPFFSTGQYGNVDHPGNCEVLIRTTYGAMVRPRPVFADLPSAPSVPDGQLLGVYCSAVEGGATDATIREAIAYASSRRVPVLVYSDTDTYPVWICGEYLNEPNRIPVLRAYPAEKPAGAPLRATPAEDVARIRAGVAELAAIFPRVAIAHTYYTQSDNYPLSHVLAMQEGIAAVERDYQIFASLGFSRLRPSGMADHPELLDAFTQEAAAPAGTPSPILLEGAAPIEPPIVVPPEPPIVVPPEPGPEPKPPEPKPPEPKPPEPKPPEPRPPEPIPIPPEPIPPEDLAMPIAIGQLGQFRPLGSPKAAWTKGIVVWSQDEHLYADKPAIFGISTDLTVDPTSSSPGHVCNWQESGKFEDNREQAGGGERTAFDGRNLMIGRPDDFAFVYEWVNLS